MHKGIELPQTLPEDVTLRERSAWESIKGEWRPLHGNFFEEGMSIEWHEFHVGEDLDWGKSFHPGSLEICLNYSGNAVIGKGESRLEVSSEQVAIYSVSKEPEYAARLAGTMHRFVTVELSPEYLKKILAGVMDGVRKNVRKFVEGQGKSVVIREVNALPMSLIALKMSLLDPPVNTSAMGVWYQSKVLEILSQIIFEENKPNEMFCHRQKRLNRERIEKVLYLLERDLENPPSLAMLGEEVECSPFYLSRMFAQETGMSIPKYLRVKRIEKAAELIKSRTMNVTEAAMAVGYSSLSAFNKAFVEQIGCCPGLYPNAKNLLEKRKSPPHFHIE